MKLQYKFFNQTIEYKGAEAVSFIMSVFATMMIALCLGLIGIADLMY